MEFYNTLKPVVEIICGGIILLETINVIHIKFGKKKEVNNNG